MLRKVFTGAAIALGIAAGAAQAATPKTTDTFSFTQGGYSVLGAVGTANLTGTFRGVVNGDFLSLTSITYTVAFSNGESLSGSDASRFFSFDVTTFLAGQGGDLGFAGGVTPGGFAGGSICVGAPAGLLASCNSSGLILPVPTNGLVESFGAGVFAATGELPTVTLVSSVTTVPEPATWALALIGVGLCGAALRRRRLSSPSVAFPQPR